MLVKPWLTPFSLSYFIPFPFRPHNVGSHAFSLFVFRKFLADFLPVRKTIPWYIKSFSSLNLCTILVISRTPYPWFLFCELLHGILSYSQSTFKNKLLDVDWSPSPLFHLLELFDFLIKFLPLISWWAAFFIVSSSLILLLWIPLPLWFYLFFLFSVFFREFHIPFFHLLVVSCFYFQRGLQFLSFRRQICLLNYSRLFRCSQGIF